MEKKKRIRRNEDQLLADTVTTLYDKIHNKIANMEDQKAAIVEIFDALDPLLELQKIWKDKNA